VLEPEGLIEKAGTEELADPLNDANLWRLTEEGAEWAVHNLDDVYEEIFDEKPGAIIVKLLHRTESVEQHMDSVRGEFESLKDEIEEVQQQDQNQESEQEVPDQYRSQASKNREAIAEQSDRLDTLRGHVQSLADDVADLREQIPSDGVGGRLESFEQRLEVVEQQADTMNSRLDEIEEENRSLAERMDYLERRVKLIE
jgi:chromosome segregation ATPase